MVSEKMASDIRKTDEEKKRIPVGQKWETYQRYLTRVSGVSRSPLALPPSDREGNLQGRAQREFDGQKFLFPRGFFFVAVRRSWWSVPRLERFLGSRLGFSSEFLPFLRFLHTSE